jgi:hypothetical protein
LLHQLGYTNVRDYRAGLEDWLEAGLPVEKLETPAPAPDQMGPELVASPDGRAGTGPARVSREGRDYSIPGLVARLSTSQLFLMWIATVVVCGFGYWLGALFGEHGLAQAGAPIGADPRGLLDALYFSFVTATSLGYGDIVPVGIARALAVVEAVAALLIFGAVVAKFVSHRQDEMVLEIHRLTFDERLDRVLSNLHIVISELLAINSLCDVSEVPLPRLVTRLDSAALLFVGELRTTRDLLYQPRLMVQEGVLSSILANLAAALDVLVELLACLPANFSRSQRLEMALKNLTGLAQDICGTCVPHSYTPRLTFWMDRIQDSSRKIH